MGIAMYGLFKPFTNNLGWAMDTVVKKKRQVDLI
jgi:hypothetical protein